MLIIPFIAAHQAINSNNNLSCLPILILCINAITVIFLICGIVWYVTNKK